MFEVGKAVRRTRMQAGLLQSDLALRANITPSFLSQIENGRRQPSLRLLEKLSDALGVIPEALVWDSIELPDSMPSSDRRVCELAKSLVRHYLEGINGREDRINAACETRNQAERTRTSHEDDRAFFGDSAT